MARAIHFSFSELPGPFVPVNCTAITHDLFESELFGYDRGAFTGAKSEGRIGRFEEAAGGTLFLDEIGSMSLSTQSKLLGVLDDRVFHRVGGSKPRRVSARIIAATNTDLEKAVEEGQFRRDLFFRLNVVKIHVPPLRERVDDIMPLNTRELGSASVPLGMLPRRVVLLSVHSNIPHHSFFAFPDINNEHLITKIHKDVILFLLMRPDERKNHVLPGRSDNISCDYPRNPGGEMTTQKPPWNQERTPWSDERRCKFFFSCHASIQSSKCHHCRHILCPHEPRPSRSWQTTWPRFICPQTIPALKILIEI